MTEHAQPLANLGALERRLADMEETRRRLHGLVQRQTPEVLRRQPAEGKWSILQIVEHLVDSEQKSVAMIRKNLAKPERRKTGPRNFFRFLALRAFFALTIPVKAPPVVAQVSDSEALDVDTLWRDWDAVRADWATLLREMPAQTRTDAVFYHPAAGGLNISQGLDFQRFHADRHGRQIHKLTR